MCNFFIIESTNIFWKCSITWLHVKLFIQNDQVCWYKILYSIPYVNLQLCYYICIQWVWNVCRLLKTKLKGFLEIQANKNGML